MAGIVEREVDRRSGSGWQLAADRVVEEAPLEIRLEGTPLAVVMRTPGHDADLMLGFALTEGILLGPGEVAGVEGIDENRWNLRLADGVIVDPERFKRNFYSTSSCGVCGKASIESVEVRGCEALPSGTLSMGADLVAGLPDLLLKGQAGFQKTE